MLIHILQNRLAKCPTCLRTYPSYIMHRCSSDDLANIINQQRTTIHYLEGQVNSLEDALNKSNDVILQLSKR